MPSLCFPRTLRCSKPPLYGKAGLKIVTTYPLDINILEESRTIESHGVSHIGSKGRVLGHINLTHEAPVECRSPYKSLTKTRRRVRMRGLNEWLLRDELHKAYVPGPYFGEQPNAIESVARLHPGQQLTDSFAVGMVPAVFRGNGKDMVGF